ncbi:unnamed protein product, partial [Didymodactylos carnosus]
IEEKKLDPLQGEKQIKLKIQDLYNQAMKLPSQTHPDSPVGCETDARVIRIVGEKPELSVSQRTVDQIGTDFNMLLLENMGQVSFRGSYALFNDFARFERALMYYTFQKLTDYVCFEFYEYLSSYNAQESCGFPTRDKRTQVYQLDYGEEFGRYCLAGTSEMALAGLLKHNTFRKDELPLKLAACSRCYRAEVAGGKSEGNLYRVHEFTKVEMYCVTSDEPGASDKMLEDIVNIQTDLYSELGLHFRILDMPTEELGLSAYRKNDIEAWMPAKQFYGEVSSASNCSDFQSRRLHIKYIDDNTEERFAHTLNGTAMALPRVITALIEANWRPVILSFSNNSYSNRHKLPYRCKVSKKFWVDINLSLERLYLTPPPSWSDLLRHVQQRANNSNNTKTNLNQQLHKCYEKLLSHLYLTETNSSSLINTTSIISNEYLYNQLELAAQYCNLKLFKDSSNLYFHCDQFFIEINFNEEEKLQTVNICITDSSTTATSTTTTNGIGGEKLSCPHMCQALKSQNYSLFRQHLNGYMSMYCLTENDSKRLGYKALKVLEYDLVLLHKQNIYKQLQRFQLSCEGLPMRIRLNEKETDEETKIDNLMDNVHDSCPLYILINLCPSPTSKRYLLAHKSIIKFHINRLSSTNNLMDVSVNSNITFVPQTLENSLLLPGYFVLEFRRPFLILSSIVDDIKILTNIDNYSSLITLQYLQTMMKTNLNEDINYYLSEDMTAIQVKQIPFTNLSQLLQIMKLIQKQYQFNLLLHECFTRQQNSENSMQSDEGDEESDKITCELCLLTLDSLSVSCCRSNCLYTFILNLSNPYNPKIISTHQKEDQLEFLRHQSILELIHFVLRRQKQLQRSQQSHNLQLSSTVVNTAHNMSLQSLQSQSSDQYSKLISSPSNNTAAIAEPNKPDQPSSNLCVTRRLSSGTSRPQWRTINSLKRSQPCMTISNDREIPSVQDLNGSPQPLDDQDQDLEGSSSLLIRRSLPLSTTESPYSSPLATQFDHPNESSISPRMTAKNADYGLKMVITTKKPTSYEQQQSQDYQQDYRRSSNDSKPYPSSFISLQQQQQPLFDTLQSAGFSSNIPPNLILPQTPKTPISSGIVPTPSSTQSTATPSFFGLSPSTPPASFFGSGSNKQTQQNSSQDGNGNNFSPVQSPTSSDIISTAVSSTSVQKIKKRPRSQSKDNLSNDADNQQQPLRATKLAEAQQQQGTIKRIRKDNLNGSNTIKQRKSTFKVQSQNLPLPPSSTSFHQSQSSSSLSQSNVVTPTSSSSSPDQTNSSSGSGDFKPLKVVIKRVGGGSGGENSTTISEGEQSQQTMTSVQSTVKKQRKRLPGQSQPMTATKKNSASNVIIKTEVMSTPDLLGNETSIRDRALVQSRPSINNPSVNSAVSNSSLAVNRSTLPQPTVPSIQSEVKPPIVLKIKRHNPAAPQLDIPLTNSPSSLSNTQQVSQSVSSKETIRQEFKQNRASSVPNTSAQQQQTTKTVLPPSIHHSPSSLSIATTYRIPKVSSLKSNTSAANVEQSQATAPKIKTEPTDQPARFLPTKKPNTIVSPVMSEIRASTASLMKIRPSQPPTKIIDSLIGGSWQSPPAAQILSNNPRQVGPFGLNKQQPQQRPSWHQQRSKTVTSPSTSNHTLLPPPPPYNNNNASPQMPPRSILKKASSEQNISDSQDDYYSSLGSRALLQPPLQVTLNQQQQLPRVNPLQTQPLPAPAQQQSPIDDDYFDDDSPNSQLVIDTSGQSSSSINSGGNSIILNARTEILPYSLINNNTSNKNTDEDELMKEAIIG